MYKSCRFSFAELPAIYLANSVYLCWLECGKPAHATCKIARFEIDDTGWRYLDLPANHATYLDPLRMDRRLPAAVRDPRRVDNSPYVEDVASELSDYLSLWPLLMSCTVQKLEPAPAQPPEYALSQLVMRWVLKRKNMLGIRYFTSKFDAATNSNDLSINVVLPARTAKQTGHCDVLLDRVRCTRLCRFADAEETDAELFSERAVARLAMPGPSVRERGIPSNRLQTCLPCGVPS
jgi:hypothetical protein